jgi:hypothetical protein
MSSFPDNDRSQDPGRGQMALRAALPLLLFTLCTIGAASLLAVRNFVNVNPTAVLYDNLAIVCTATPAPRAAPYDPSQTPPKLVAFRQLSDGRLQLDSTILPADWQPNQVEETALVLCLSNERPAIRAQCTADGRDSGYTTPFGREITAVLRTASDGQILTEGQISSVPNAPDGCLPQLPPAPPPDEPVSSANIQAWLLPYLQP